MAATPTKEDKMRAMRVNPAYLYEIADAKTKGFAEKAAQAVAEDAWRAGANTLFVQAYNSKFGAYYPTDYPHTEVEKGLGRQDIFGILLRHAHQRGLRVIAWLPVNEFRRVWLDEPKWRSKRRDGSDYRPRGESYLLSASSEGFRQWYQGFLSDLVQHHRSLDGIEGAEGTVDVHWREEADFNAEALRNFSLRFPGQEPAGEIWKRFRADALTSLHGLLSSVTHRYKKEAYVVQTWAPHQNGDLMESHKIRDATGFDFNGIMDEPPPGRPDFILAELIWQEWHEKYPAARFDALWTRRAAKEFSRRVAGRATPIAHVELTKFGDTTPSLDAFEQALKEAIHETKGAVFYDYYLCKQRNAFTHVRRAYLPGSFSGL